MKGIISGLKQMWFSNQKRKREDTDNKGENTQSNIENDNIMKENSIYSSMMKRRKKCNDDMDKEICPHCTSEILRKQYDHVFTTCQRNSTLSKMRKSVLGSEILDTENFKVKTIQEEQNEINDNNKINKDTLVKNIDFNDVEMNNGYPLLNNNIQLSPPEKEINESNMINEFVKINADTSQEKTKYPIKEDNISSNLNNKPKRPHKPVQKIDTEVIKEENKPPEVFNLVDDDDEEYNMIKVVRLYESYQNSEMDSYYDKFKWYVSKRNDPDNFPLISKGMFEKTASVLKNALLNTNDNLSINFKSYLTLNKGEWLNDEIINSYGALINKSKPDVKVFTSFLYQKLSLYTTKEEVNAYYQSELASYFKSKKVSNNFLIIDRS